MKRFVECADRTQVNLLPDCIDDYVGTDNPVQVIEAFVEQLDLREMGFESVDPEATGRPAYHPSVMLKIYI
jgi:transposase